MGEKLTAERAAKVVKHGDALLVTVHATGTTLDGKLCYEINGDLNGDFLWSGDAAIKSVELLPPEPKPGEWWLVKVDGRERVMFRTGGEAWAVTQHGDDWPDGGPLAVTVLRKMVFEEGER